MSERKTLYVIDDEAEIRTTLEKAFRFSGFNVISFSSPVSALQHELDTLNSCILLDLSMPGMGGVEFQRLMHEKGIEIPIVFYSGKADIDSAVDAMSGGAFTFIRKPARHQLILDKVEEAITNHCQKDDLRAQAEEASAILTVLSVRELQVAELVANGHTAMEIADILFISSRTVEAHRHSIFEKLNIKSVARLAQIILLSNIKRHQQRYNSHTV
jgi:FixJ family two-component response regulator